MNESQCSDIVDSNSSMFKCICKLNRFQVPKLPMQSLPATNIHKHQNFPCCLDDLPLTITFGRIAFLVKLLSLPATNHMERLRVTYLGLVSFFSLSIEAKYLQLLINTSLCQVFQDVPQFTSYIYSGRNVLESPPLFRISRRFRLVL